VFQWFPLSNLITDKQRLFCLMKQKQFWSYFVSSYTHWFIWSDHM